MRRLMTLSLAFALLLGGVFVATLELRSDARASSPTGPDNGFVGAWRVTLPNDRPALATFTSDGIFLPTSFVVHSAPTGAPYHYAFLSAGTGRWIGTGPRTAAVTSFVLESNELADYVGALRIRASVTLGPDGQTLDGDYEFEITAPDERVVEAGSGAIHGVRIQVEPMGTPSAVAGT
jgi:hypothetical protein